MTSYPLKFWSLRESRSGSVLDNVYARCGLFAIIRTQDNFRLFTAVAPYIEVLVNLTLLGVTTYFFNLPALLFPDVRSVNAEDKL